jgi:hypothetical protein
MCPWSYRRVEGKYGLSYNAENLKELEQFKIGNGSAAGACPISLRGRFPAYRPGDDQASWAICHRADRPVEINLDGYLSWISDNPHPTRKRPKWRTAPASYLAREIMTVPPPSMWAASTRPRPTSSNTGSTSSTSRDGCCSSAARSTTSAATSDRPGYLEDLAPDRQRRALRPTSSPNILQTVRTDPAGCELPGEHPGRAVWAAGAGAGPARDEARAGRAGCGGRKGAGPRHGLLRGRGRFGGRWSLALREARALREALARGETLGGEMRGNGEMRDDETAQS